MQIKVIIEHQLNQYCKTLSRAGIRGVHFRKNAQFFPHFFIGNMCDLPVEIFPIHLFFEKGN